MEAKENQDRLKAAVQEVENLTEYFLLRLSRLAMKTELPQNSYANKQLNKQFLS